MLQTVLVDIEMQVDAAQIGQSDDLAQTVDYAAMAEKLGVFASGQSFKLIETLVEKLAEHIHQHFAVKQLKINLQKPGAVPQAKSVGVVIERTFS